MKFKFFPPYNLFLKFFRDSIIYDQWSSFYTSEKFRQFRKKKFQYRYCDQLHQKENFFGISVVHAHSENSIELFTPSQFVQGQDPSRTETQSDRRSIRFEAWNGLVGWNRLGTRIVGERELANSESSSNNSETNSMVAPWNQAWWQDKGLAARGQKGPPGLTLLAKLVASPLPSSCILLSCSLSSILPSSLSPLREPRTG